MTHALVYTNNGRLEIEYPNTKKGHSINDLSPPDGVNDALTIDMDESMDKNFRGSWVLNDGTIEYDLEKARDIQLARIREARNIKLIFQDNLIRVIQDSGASNGNMSAARLERKRLRDITEPLKDMTLTGIQQIKDAFPEDL